MLLGSTVALRAIEKEDLALIRDWRNDPRLRQYFREYRELSMADQTRWFDSLTAPGVNSAMFMIMSAETRQPVGVCGLCNINRQSMHAEISLYIGTDGAYVDDRFAPDTLDLLIRYGFGTLNLNRLWVECYDFDRPKIALVAERAGFRREGTLRDHCYHEGQYHDSHLFSLLRGDYRPDTRGTETRDEIDWPYFKRQYDEPYQHTKDLYTFLEANGAFREDTTIVDYGAGSGSNIAYFAGRRPDIDFIGYDILSVVMDWGNRQLAERGHTRAYLERQDILMPNRSQYPKQVDGVFSTHFLLLFDDFETPLREMLKLNPRWIASNSLFFDGKVNTTILRDDYNDPHLGKPYRRAHYNIYSVPLVREFLARAGYEVFHYQPFEIGIDLPRTGSDLGTYTVRTEDGRRLQISGPLLMNWGLILAMRRD